MYTINSFATTEIKNNYEFTEQQATEREIKFYQIQSLFGSLLRDFYYNKYGASQVERFDVFVDKFNQTLKTDSVFYHIAVGFSNISDYKLTIQVTSKGMTYVFITKINGDTKCEASFEVEDFNKISFEKSGELNETFKQLIERFNK